MQEARSGFGKVIIALAAIVIAASFCGMTVIAFVVIKHLMGEIAAWIAPGAAVLLAGGVM